MAQSCPLECPTRPSRAYKTYQAAPTLALSILDVRRSSSPHRTAHSSSAIYERRFYSSSVSMTMDGSFTSRPCTLRAHRPSRPHRYHRRARHRHRPLPYHRHCHHPPLHLHLCPRTPSAASTSASWRAKLLTISPQQASLYDSSTPWWTMVSWIGGLSMTKRMGGCELRDRGGRPSTRICAIGSPLRSSTSSCPSCTLRALLASCLDHLSSPCGARTHVTAIA